MGDEELVRWMLTMLGVLGQVSQYAVSRPMAQSKDIRQLQAGQSEYLPSIPVSVTGSPQRLRGKNRQSWRMRQRNVLGVVSSPDDLFSFQAQRLAVS